MTLSCHLLIPARTLTFISVLGVTSGLVGCQTIDNEDISSNCNGVDGPYILTADNILLIGSGAQTMMGCGPKREAAEDKIREIEQLSKSQLTLQSLPNTNIDDPSLPYYFLTQRLDSGETLIWKNIANQTR